MEKQNYSDEEFESLLSSYDYTFKKGDLVKGTVYGYDSEGAIIDIGAKTTASVPLREAVSDRSVSIESALEKGKEYEFLIISDEDLDGKMQLSSLKVQQAYTWKELEKLKEANETILGEISTVVKGGLIVDILGVKGFVPSSQLRSKEQEFTVGEKLELKILTLDNQQNSFILSNKKVYSEASEEEKANLFAQIEIGQVLKGDVVRITDFGAFVDLGGVDGLLPLSQISWKWIDHPSDRLKIGEKIEVEVISIDHDKHRISLSLKNLEEDPWLEAEKVIKEGELREGIITRIKAFGAFVEIYPGVEALLPQAELTEYGNNNNMIPKVGDTIKTYVSKFNPQDRRIALSVTEPELANV
ncbi:S1 RNA-binding domain-containing protein [bacterium]|nr:S1 RNA-binding domain-containing protein [bacterium]